MGSQPASRRQLVLAAVVVAVVAVGTMARSTAGDFVWDDRWLVLESPPIRGDVPLFAALGRDYFHGAEPTLRYGYYRPVSTLSLALTYRVAADNPVAYHATNLILHAAVSVLLLFLGLAVGLRLWPAAAGALLFAVHPVHVESVCWVSGRTDLLAAAFGLGGLLLFVTVLTLEPKQRKALSPRRFWLLIAAATLLTTVALLAKEAALVVPLLVAVICRGNPARPVSWRRLGRGLAPLSVLMAAYLVFRLFVVALPDAGIDGTTLTTRFASAGAGVVRYLFLFVAPFQQLPYMRVPLVESLFAPLALLGFALVAAVGLLWARGRRRWEWQLAVLAGCFLTALLPLLNFIRIMSPDDMGFTMAERFLYLPSAFLCLLVGSLGYRAVEKAGTTVRVATVALGCALLLLLAGTSYVRAATWLDELTLFEHMVRTTPGAPLPHVLLSQALRRSGDAEAAATEAARAAEIFAAGGHPPPAALSVTVAGVMMAQGRVDEAARLMEDPRVQNLQAPAVHRDLATIYRLQRRFDEAEEQLQRALELEPDNVNTWLSMTLLRLQSGNLDGAREAAERCRQLAPDAAEAHHAAGIVARVRGDLVVAEAELRQAASSDEPGSRVLTDLGVLLSETGRHEEAVATLRRAVAAESNLGQANLPLAVALLRAGDIDGGIEVLEPLAEDHPRDVQVLVTLSRAQLARGDRAAAHRVLSQAEELAPDDRRVQNARREVGHAR